MEEKYRGAIARSCARAHFARAMRERAQEFFARSRKNRARARIAQNTFSIDSNHCAFFFNGSQPNTTIVDSIDVLTPVQLGIPTEDDEDYDEDVCFQITEKVGRNPMLYIYAREVLNWWVTKS